MPDYLRLLLAPLFGAVAVATLFLGAAVWGPVPPGRILLWLGSLTAGALAWWKGTRLHPTWSSALYSLLLGGLVGLYAFDLGAQGPVDLRLAFGVTTLALGAVGSFILAPFFGTSVLWAGVLIVPGITLIAPQVSDDALVFLGLALGAWQGVNYLRHRSHLKLAQAWKQLESRTKLDPLYGLDLRPVFLTRLERAWTLVETSVLVTVSVDRFAQISDTLGMAVSDDLLHALAGRVQAQLRPGDSATGDGDGTLLVLLAGGPGPAGVERRAVALVELLEGTYELGTTPLPVRVHAGLALGPVEQVSLRDWIHQSRAALAEAQEARTRLRWYDPELHARRCRRQRWAGDLEAALDRGQFTLVYQPQFEVTSGRIVGAEALVRWRHPFDGLIGPQDFIPLAEETGFITALGVWILREALQTARTWPESWRISVNVSAHQLADEAFPGQVWRALEASDLEPRRLTLEITESVLISDGPRTREVLQRFQDRGIRISLDDFGTGYSSLLYLRNYPLDELKVDQAFVRSLEGHRESLAIVETILSLARTLGIATTAEGIENRGQAEILKAFGCGVLQGYFYSPPVEDPTALLQVGEAGLHR